MKKPNLKEWLKNDYWDPCEAICLFHQEMPKSGFMWHEKYSNSIDLIMRSIKSGNLKAWISRREIRLNPYDAIGWAIEKEHPLPKEYRKAYEIFKEKESKKLKKKKEGDLSSKEKDSLLKLVIGMAVEGYKYDPKQSRNGSITDIASDLESLGISLDQDTVRKWLKEASQLLPQNPRKH